MAALQEMLQVLHEKPQVLHKKLQLLHEKASASILPGVEMD